MDFHLPHLTVTSVYEQELKNQISTLQERLLDFNRHISPAKRTKAEVALPPRIFDTSWIVRLLGYLTENFITTLGHMVWLLWPLGFPLLLYLSLGSTLFFKQVAFCSILLTSLLIARAAMDLYEEVAFTSSSVLTPMEQLWRRIRHMHETVLLKVEDEKRMLKKYRVGQGFQAVMVALVLATVLILSFRCKGTVSDGHMVCGGFAVVCFLLGLYLPFLKRAQSEPLPFRHLSESICVGGPLHSSPNHSVLGVPDLMSSGTGFSPIKCKPPPTYQEAISQSTSPMHPSCRMALFQ